MIQKLSPRMPSLGSRMKVLKEIATKNHIILQLEEVSSVADEELVSVKKEKQHEPEIREEENSNVLLNRGKDQDLSLSFKAKQKYKDIAEAAQAAFESAAARAAVELSRSEPHDPDDHNGPSPPPRKVLDGHDSVKAMSHLEDKELEIISENKVEEFNKSAGELEKPKDTCSSNSDDEILLGDTLPVDAEIEADPFVKELVFDESDNETDKEQNKNHSYSFKLKSSSYHGGIEVGSGVLNEMLGSKMQSAPNVDLEMRPFSVMTRRVNGY